MAKREKVDPALEVVQETAPVEVAEVKEAVTEVAAKVDDTVATLSWAGWHYAEHFGKWTPPTNLAYYDDGGSLTIPARGSFYTAEEALALEARRHRQP